MYVDACICKARGVATVVTAVVVVVMVVRLGLHLQRDSSGLHVSHSCYRGLPSCDYRLLSVSRTSGRN